MTAVNRKRALQIAAPRFRQPRHRTYGKAAVVIAVAALTAAAAANRYLAKKAEAANPPVGKFIEVDGVELHYVEHGSAINHALDFDVCARTITDCGLRIAGRTRGYRASIYLQSEAEDWVLPRRSH